MNTSRTSPNLQNLKRKEYIILSLFAIFLLYFKTVYWMMGSWIMNPYYSHGFLVLAISLYLIYREFKRATSNSLSYASAYKNLGLITLCLAVVVHTFAVFYQYLWISAVTFPFSIFGIVMIFYGEFSKKLAFPIFFLLLAVPYPIYGVANKLEIFSASASVFITRLIGIKTALVGAEIITAGGKFMVGAPCSGIRSILAMLTVIVLYVYLIDDCFKAKAILVILSIPLAMFANILRIVSVVVTANYFSLQIAMGFVHTVSDIVLFVLALLILIALRRVVSKLCV